MAASEMRRFVLVEDYLEPGHIHINSPTLAKEIVYVELRRTTGVPLPFENIKDLVASCRELIVDPFTYSHEEVIDCLMLGVDNVCIDAGAPLRELELAYAASMQVISRFWIESWPPDDYDSKSLHYKYLRKVAHTCGRDAVATSPRKGVIGMWWDDLPADCRKAFNWHIAPPEGRKIAVKVQPSGWLL
jgi:hypothetical protein